MKSPNIHGIARLLPLVLILAAFAALAACSSQEPPDTMANPSDRSLPPGIARSLHAITWQTRGDGTPSCVVGIYLANLDDIDPVSQTFYAYFWAWSLCPMTRDTLIKMDYLNGKDITRSLYGRIHYKGGYWGLMKISGTFRAQLDTRRYPFDHHTLRIWIEEPLLDIREFHLVPDTSKSVYNPGIHPEGWRITGFRLTRSDHEYVTNFGDPSATQAGSIYPRLLLEIDIARSDRTNFVKIVAPVYIAWMLSIAAFFLVMDSKDVMLSRLGILGSALFAIVINMQNSDNSVGGFPALTLVDEIHITALIFVVIAALITIFTWRLRERPSHTVRDVERRFLILGVCLYVAANTSLIAYAAAQ
jgi:hypothetical protein